MSTSNDDEALSDYEGSEEGKSFIRRLLSKGTKKKPLKGNQKQYELHDQDVRVWWQRWFSASRKNGQPPEQLKHKSGKPRDNFKGLDDSTMGRDSKKGISLRFPGFKFRIFGKGS